MANRTQKSIPLLMIIPSLVLAFLIIGYPILDLAWTSTQEVSRFGKLMGFTGWSNFADVFGDPLFWSSLGRTGIWTFCVVGGTLLLSMPIAMILNDDFFGRGLMRVIIMLPWSISLTMTAVVWRWALNGRAGLLNATLMDAGIIHEPIEWLATAEQDTYEAAMVDGASRWHQFRYITLPLMKPFINIAIVLNVIYVFNSLPIIWVMTEGGPANGTDILVTYLYKLAFRFGQLGKAAAISLVMFGVLLIFTLLYVVLVSRNEEDAAPEEETEA